MRKILIVGAGQAGLQLGLGLVQNGYDVTVMSNRTPDEIRTGRVMSSQCMFHTALQHERDLGHQLLGGGMPAGRGDRALPCRRPTATARRSTSPGPAGRYAQAVDQRVKMAGLDGEVRAAAAASS